MPHRFALVLIGKEADIQKFLECLAEKHTFKKEVVYVRGQNDTFMGEITTGTIINFDQVIDLCAECDYRVQAGITELEDDVPTSFL